jgi:hypothetical protein
VVSEESSKLLWSDVPLLVMQQRRILPMWQIRGWSASLFFSGIIILPGVTCTNTPEYRSSNKQKSEINNDLF